MKWLLYRLSFVFVLIFICTQLVGQSLLSNFRGEPDFPECEEPVRPVIESFNSESALIRWVEPDDAYGQYSYEVRYRSREKGIFHQWNAVSVNRRYGVNIDNLLPGQQYEVEIRRICDEQLGLRSEWVNIGAFTTLSSVNSRLNSDSCQLLHSVNLNYNTGGQIIIDWIGPQTSGGYDIRHRGVLHNGPTPWNTYSVNEGNRLVLNESILYQNALNEFQISMKVRADNGDGLQSCSWEDAGEILLSDALVDNDTTPLPIELPDFQCGDPFVPDNVDQTSSLDTAQVGDVFFIYGFPVKLTQVTGENGTFSGEGVVPLPFQDKAIKVEFSNV